MQSQNWPPCLLMASLPADGLTACWWPAAACLNCALVASGFCRQMYLHRDEGPPVNRHRHARRLYVLLSVPLAGDPAGELKPVSYAVGTFFTDPTEGLHLESVCRGAVMRAVSAGAG